MVRSGERGQWTVGWYLLKQSGALSICLSSSRQGEGMKSIVDGVW